jgi:hypothetical protein
MQAKLTNAFVKDVTASALDISITDSQLPDSNYAFDPPERKPSQRRHRRETRQHDSAARLRPGQRVCYCVNAERLQVLKDMIAAL